MQLNLTDKETQTLLQLIYVGNYVINTYLDEPTEHEDFAQNLYAKYLREVEKLPEAEITDDRIGVLREEIIDVVDQFLENYEDATRDEWSESLLSLLSCVCFSEKSHILG